VKRILFLFFVGTKKLQKSPDHTKIYKLFTDVLNSINLFFGVTGVTVFSLMYVAANFFPYTIGSIIDVGSIRYTLPTWKKNNMQKMLPIIKFAKLRIKKFAPAFYKYKILSFIL